MDSLYIFSLDEFFLNRFMMSIDLALKYLYVPDIKTQ